MGGTGLVQLVEVKAPGDLAAACQYQLGGYQEDSQALPRAKGHKMKQNNTPNRTEGNFFSIMRAVKQWNKLPEVVQAFSSSAFQDLAR